MSTNSIAINYAIMIERLRSQGVENSQIINALKEGNYEYLNHFGNGMPDWETLGGLYNKDVEAFKNLLENGYQVRFLTKGSLMTLLRLKYGIEVEKDYVDAGEAIEGIQLSPEAIQEVKAFLALNWKLSTYVSDDEPAITKVRIELVKSSEFASL